MNDQNYNLWTEIFKHKQSNLYHNDPISNPLSHLKNNYLNVKSPVGFSGISNIYKFYGGKLTYNQIKNFLKTVDSYSLHKKSRVLNYNPGFSKYHRQQIQIDLVDIQKLANQNDGYHYLLTGIDTFTRFGFCEPLKNKNPILC